MTVDTTTLKERFQNWMSGGAFSDEEASDFSGLPVRTLRELHKVGALTPLSSRPGRGNRRLWDRDAIVRAAQVAGVMTGGLSLPVSARVALAWTNSSSTKDAFSYAPDWESIHDATGQSSTPRRKDGRDVVSVWLTDEFAEGQVDVEGDAFLKIVDNEHLIAEVVDYDADILRRLRVDPGERQKRIRLGRLQEGGLSIVSTDYIHAQRALTQAQIAAFDLKVDGESVREILERFEIEGLEFLKGGGRYVDPEFLRLSPETDGRPWVRPSSPEEVQARVRQKAADEQALIDRILGTARSILSINMTLAERRTTRRALGLADGPRCGASEPPPSAPQGEQT
jgi:DNA-binding transcriptional MerR regulator